MKESNITSVDNDTPHDLVCWTWGGWETDRHYRRMGSSPISSFSSGEWMDTWRERITSTEAIKMMVDSGISLVVTCFYKGFGKVHEASEWPRLKEYVANCHEHGIQVWGYLQGQSIYYETVLTERPDAKDWVAQRYDGSPDSWGAVYYRQAPCLNSTGYGDYMLELVDTGLTEIGLDGIHLDNSYSKHCYCPRCRNLFRDFLRELPDLEERTGLTTPDHVQPPPLPETLSILSDPLRQLWVEFGTQSRLRFIKKLYRRIKELKPNAVFHTNPAFPKRLAAKQFLSFDPVREADVCDFVCAEGSNLPRVEFKHAGSSSQADRFFEGIDTIPSTGKPTVTQAVLYSQAEAYLFADACGYRVLNTSWHNAACAGNSAGFWTGLAEEFSYHSAILGNNWLFRAAGDGNRFLGDNREWRESHAAAVHFFRSLHHTLQLGSRKQWGELGLYIQPDNFSLMGQTDMPVFRATVNYLVAKNIPLVFIMLGQTIPPSVKTLFVCQQSCLTEQDLDQVRTFTTQPGRNAWILGTSGRCNEHTLPRNLSAWHTWRNSPNMIADAGNALDWVQPFTGVRGPEVVWINRTGEKALDRLLSSEHWQPYLRADLPNYILMNSEQTTDGRLLLHLRDQASKGELICGARLVLSGSLATTRQARLYTPGENGPLKLETSPDPTSGTAVLTLPDFKHYALIVL